MPVQKHIMEYQGTIQVSDINLLLKDLAIELLELNTVNEIVWKLNNFIIKRLSLEDCVIYLLEEDGRYLEKKAASEYEDHPDRTAKNKISRVKLGEGVVGNVGLEKTPIIIGNTTEIEHYIIDEELRLSEIAVPILINDELIGVIDSEHPAKNYFTLEHKQILTAIAELAAIKLKNAKKQERLNSRHKHIDLIFNSTSDLTFLMGVEPNSVFRCLSVNQAYLDAIDLTKEQIIGRTLSEIWSPEKADFFAKKYQKVVNSRSSITYRVNYDDVDPPVVAETMISPIFDSDGHCIYISGISRDITSSIKAQEALKESKEQFENLFEYSPYAIFIHDFKKITNVNQAFLDLFKYSKKERIIGQSPLESLVMEEDIPLVREARKNRNFTIPSKDPQVRFLRADGEFFIGEGHVSTVVIDGVTQLRVAVQDVTKRIENQRELEENELKYRTLFVNSLDGIYKSTPGGKFVEVNPALVKMLGYESEEELKSIDIKADLYFKEEDRKIMASHEEDQYRLKRKDGSSIWVEDHGYYEYDEKGNIIYHHGILRDVTSKIEKQNQLEGLLTVTNEQNTKLQDFAHIVSHNIKSHSSNMSSLIQIMEMTSEEGERAHLFSMLKSSADKLGETVRNLNEIISSNQDLLKPREARNLACEVDNTLKVLSGDIRTHNVQVVVDIPKELDIKVIPAYLDSILLNIISNAIKYRSPDREVILHIKAEQDEQFIQLSIADNGLGIDMKRNADKIFGMYQTFHGNKDSRGFGLYITKNQIESLGGRIEVESEIDKGSTFKISFKK